MKDIHMQFFIFVQSTVSVLCLIIGCSIFVADNEKMITLSNELIAMVMLCKCFAMLNDILFVLRINKNLKTIRNF